MNMQSKSNIIDVPVQEIEDIAKKRRPSGILMELLLEERLYVQASELALGMESVFAMLGRQLDQIIEDQERGPSCIRFTGQLTSKIDEAHAEIGFHCWWSQQVLSELPDTIETQAIRNSFKQVASVRGQLLSKLLAIHDQYPLAKEQSVARRQAQSLAAGEQYVR
jgi:hypothetical protein